MSSSRTRSIGSAHEAPRFGLTDLGLILMAIIWGVNYSVMKAGMRDMPPIAFAGLRVVIATLILLCIASFVRSVPWPTGRDRWRLLLLGLLGNGLYQLFFVFGLARTRAGVASLITAAGPAWIAMFSRALGRERLTATGWTGIALQLLGAGCVVGSTQGFEGEGAVLLGAILIACGSVSWGLFSVLLQPYTLRAHPLHLSSLTLASGALVILAAGAPELQALEWGAITAAQWGAVLYASIGSLVLAYLLFYRGVRLLGPTKTAMYGNLQPLVALSVAWVMLGERPSMWQLLGASCIMAGLLISRLSRGGDRPTTSRQGKTA